MTIVKSLTIALFAAFVAISFSSCKKEETPADKIEATTSALENQTLKLEKEIKAKEEKNKSAKDIK